MRGVLETLKPVLNRLGKYKYVLLVVAAGLVLLMWPNAPPGGGAKDNAAKTEAVQDDSVSQELERQLEDILSRAQGVGRVSVLLTRRQDMETQYVVDQESRDKREWSGGALQSYEQSSDSTVVMRRDPEGGEQPLVKSRVYPVYQGALVVCDGADDTEVRVRILEAVASLTGLGYDKISVVRMQPDGNTVFSIDNTVSD